MKKRFKKIVSAAALLFLLAILFTGCSSGNVSYEGKSYDASAEDVETVRIDVKDRKIEIIGSEDEKIHLSYFESEKEAYTVSISDTKELSMVCSDNKSWTDYVGKKAAEDYRTIRLSIPNGKIQNLKLITSNEDIVLPALNMKGSVEINVNKGSIVLDRLDAGKSIQLETKNGNITGTIIGSYDEYAIKSQARKGENNLPPNKEQGDKKLSAYTNNGDIELEIIK